MSLVNRYLKQSAVLLCNIYVLIKSPSNHFQTRNTIFQKRLLFKSHTNVIDLLFSRCLKLTQVQTLILVSSHDENHFFTPKLHTNTDTYCQPFKHGLQAHSIATGQRITFLLPRQDTVVSLMVDLMGAQHEQLEANPVLWLKGFADDKQGPRQPEVLILNLHSSLCMRRQPSATLQSEITLCRYCLCLDLAVMVTNSNNPTKTLETESNILKRLQGQKQFRIRTESGSLVCYLYNCSSRLV